MPSHGKLISSVKRLRFIVSVTYVNNSILGASDCLLCTFALLSLYFHMEFVQFSGFFFVLSMLEWDETQNESYITKMIRKMRTEQ